VTGMMFTRNHPPFLGSLSQSKRETSCRTDDSPLTDQTALNRKPRVIHDNRKGKLDDTGTERIDIFGRGSERDESTRNLRCEDSWDAPEGNLFV
jgi:hypothetical protein